MALTGILLALGLQFLWGPLVIVFIAAIASKLARIERF